MKTAIAILLTFTTLGAEAQDIVLPPALYTQQRGKGVSIGGCGRQAVLYNDTVFVKNLLLIEKTEIRLQTYGYMKLTRDEIKTMPYTDINDMLSIFPTVYQRQRGMGLNVAGARVDGMLYILDGMIIM